MSGNPTYRPRGRMRLDLGGTLATSLLRLRRISGTWLVNRRLHESILGQHNSLWETAIPASAAD
jgi:hypothetical protein